MKVAPFGPRDADILIVGEVASNADTSAPFTDSAGLELSRMLKEAGLSRTGARVTYVYNDVARYEFYFKNAAKLTGPNDKIMRGVTMLEAEINLVKPKVIIAAGKLALWALTGETTISNWRGSIMQSKPIYGQTYTVIPIYPPSMILKMWQHRYITVNDLKRVKALLQGTIEPPEYDFLIRPSFDDVVSRLRWLIGSCQMGPTRVAVDIETKLGHIDCIGLGWSPTEAICIPFISQERRGDDELPGDKYSYWSKEEELEIILLLRELLTHENFLGVGQNWQYDAQYIARHWGFKMNLWMDTMIAHHTAFPGLEKSLNFLASMYLGWYEYWKEERKSQIEEEGWTYNCKDCCITYALIEPLQKTINALGVREPYNFQMKIFNPVLNIVLRGVRIDTLKRKEFAMTLLDEMAFREQYFKDVLGHPLNPRSSKQMPALFYTDFNQKPIRNRKSGSLTCDDNALTLIGAREPLLRPLCVKIKEYRTIGIFNSTFVGAPLDHDGRIRCQFKITGTETFRFASSEDAFGYGTNLQNVPKEKKSSRPENYEPATREEDILELPNIRSLFIPDPGYVLLDCDLPQADAQVVAWDAGAEGLKDIFKRAQIDPTVDLHNENTKTIFGKCEGRDDPNRPKAKAGVHATNYGASPYALARALNITQEEARHFQEVWFNAHPEIKAWQDRIQTQLQTTRTVQNQYGYKRFYFDRLDKLLPEALAWIPQSTVAIAINKILYSISTRLRGKVHILLQVHDSIVMQVKEKDLPEVLPTLKECLRVVIPYEDPLVLHAGLDISDVSWGHVKPIEKTRWASLY